MNRRFHKIATKGNVVYFVPRSQADSQSEDEAVPTASSVEQAATYGADSKIQAKKSPATQIGTFIGRMAAAELAAISTITVGSVGVFLTIVPVAGVLSLFERLAGSIIESAEIVTSR